MASSAESPAEGRLRATLRALVAGHDPLRTAVVHPTDSVSLSGALEAARLGLIVPVLIGPKARIEAAAVAAALSLDGVDIVDVPHSHAAAEAGCRMAAAAEVAAVMKGGLHTNELLSAAVDRTHGIRTDRRMSHIFIMDVPAFSHPFLITDAAVNVAPDLTVKRDIVQNAIDCAHALGIATPRVAVLAAVETIEPFMSATIDAAALSKMSDRGQIVGGIVDGPLAFDNAISAEAAGRKGIVSTVAGRADVLVAPTIEAGNIMAKQFAYVAGAESAGIVMGARVPIILTSRADGRQARLASCMVALLVARHERLKPQRGD